VQEAKRADFPSAQHQEFFSAQADQVLAHHITKEELYTNNVKIKYK
jgi:hypothetical protein